MIPSSTKLSRSLSDLRALGNDRRERVMDYDECPWVSLASRVPNPSEEVLFVIRKKSVTQDAKAQPPRPPLQRTRHASLCSSSAYSTNYADPQKLFRTSPNLPRLPEIVAVSPCLLQVIAGNFCLILSGYLLLQIWHHLWNAIFEIRRFYAIWTGAAERDES